MRSTIFLTLSVSVAALQGCASTPGARPQEMSAAEHDQAAGVHEAQGSGQQVQVSPNAQPANGACSGAGSLCWSDVTNPSEEQMADAENHRKMAADHRAASQALREAEARSCAGLSNDDRDMSPFTHRQDIQEATGTYLHRPEHSDVNAPSYAAPSYVHVSGKNARDELVGATVTLRAVRGLTAEWLQRIVDCHIARNSALGNIVPEMSWCPLVPKGASAKVETAGNAFAVTIASSDPKTAKEILRRAMALTSGN